ncbi:MAG: NTPase [Candidatus Hydrogenedentota bacterium]|nr:MAG: NTPase [Candidatus Hydrogenedentota bacterium]
MPAKILLTGVPGVGKTTIVREVARLLGQSAGGFYTEELRQGGERVGFNIVTLDGRRAVLSHKEHKSRHRVGKYGVDTEAIESVAASAIENAIARDRTIIIDEIGKMELFSRKFRESVMRAFDSPSPVLAVIMLRPNPFADSIKRRPGVRTFEAKQSNRDSLPSQIMGELGCGP